MESTQFSELVTRLRKGDTAAVEQFVAEYGEAMRREVRFMLLDSRLRRVVGESDVCQSVLLRFFVELWAGKYDFEDPKHLEAFLKKMVRSRIIDLTRHWMAQRRDLRKNTGLASLSDSRQTSNEATPSRITANAELLAEVRRRLSRQEQEILDLRQEGLLWPEIANRVGGACSAEALRKQYERALDRVSAQLGFEGG